MGTPVPPKPIQLDTGGEDPRTNPFPKSSGLGLPARRLFLLVGLACLFPWLRRRAATNEDRGHHGSETREPSEQPHNFVPPELAAFAGRGYVRVNRWR